VCDSKFETNFIGVETQSSWSHGRSWLIAVLNLRQAFLAKGIKEIDVAVVCGA
jgi:hypothetical protein